MSDLDLLELAWGLIANAGGGDWQTQTQEWRDAAGRWRDLYMARVLTDEPLRTVDPSAPCGRDDCPMPPVDPRTGAAYVNVDHVGTVPVEPSGDPVADMDARMRAWRTRTHASRPECPTAECTPTTCIPPWKDGQA